jgi:hypothetical protein
MTNFPDFDRLVFHEVDSSLWVDFDRLFESRGGPKACWCMVWRATPEEEKLKDGASRKAAMAKRIAAGVPSDTIIRLAREYARQKLAALPGVRPMENNSSVPPVSWPP